MEIQQIHKLREGIPHMSYSQAEEMTNFILNHQLKHILELGFYKGVSSCYIAGALDEMGNGHLTSIDLTNSRAYDPNIDTLLSKIGLSDYVTVYYEPTSYTWRMMKMLEENPVPRFDLCYIDGAHDWFTDGFAFFLVNQLLKPGGWIIFDDLDWTYDSSPSLKDTEEVQNMPADEKTTPHIRKVYELLVKQHPLYDQFRENDGWAYAHKMESSNGTGTPQVKKEIVHEYKDRYIGMAALMRRAINKFSGSLKS